MTPLALRTSAGAVRRALAVVEDGRVVPLNAEAAEHTQRDLKPRLDALEAASLEALRDALAECRDALVARVRKASDFAALANDLKRLPRFGAVEMEVRAMLDRAREAGRKDLRREMREGRRDFAEWDESKHPRKPSGSDAGGEFAPKDEWGISKKLTFKPTNALLEIEARNLEDYAQKSLNSWIILGQTDKYQAIMERVRRLRHAMTLRGLNARKEFLELNESSTQQRDFADSSFTPKAALRWLRATAFWISGILDDRILADVKGIVLNGLKTGVAGSVMAEQVRDAFVPWLGDPDVIRDEQQLQPWRLETIVRTNTTTAYNHGRLSEIVDPEIARFVKGIRYSAILDLRTTEVCRFLDGKVFKPTDPNLEALLPPNHFSCRSIIVPIVAGEKIDEDEFITPAEIGRARELADAKFLTQDDAWRAYREGDDDAEPAKAPPSRATEFTVARQADGTVKITRTEVTKDG